jgi:AcrR family transcriptional regulator
MERGPSQRRAGESQQSGSQRERILRALAEISAESGSAAATIQAIVTRAGTSKRTFYREFARKEEALAAIADSFRERVMKRVDPGESAARGTRGADALRQALASMLAAAAAEPDEAKVVFLEPGPEGRPAGERLIAELLERSADLAPDSPPSPAAARAARAGAEGLIVDQLIAGRADSLPALLPEIVYISLVPQLGQQEALRQSQMAVQDSK